MDTKYFSIREQADGWYWEDESGDWYGPYLFRDQAVDEQMDHVREYMEEIVE